MPTITGTSFLGVHSYEWFNVAAPEPGIHQFTLTRTGTQTGFYLNGKHLNTLNGSELPLQRLTLLFYGPASGEMSPLYVDRVQVVPAPGAMLLLAAPTLVCARRRRRLPSL